MASDWENAKQYMDPFHRWCLDMHGFYYNSQNYASLKKENKFPSTAIQEDVDQFVADVRDKLFYAGRSVDSGWQGGHRRGRFRCQTGYARLSG